MEVNGLINLIKKEMKGKNPWLRIISVSTTKNPVLYINEESFTNLDEYRFLHELAQYKILDEEIDAALIKFSANPNTKRALNNPEEYFAQK